MGSKMSPRSRARPCLEAVRSRPAGALAADAGAFGSQVEKDSDHGHGSTDGQHQPNSRRGEQFDGDTGQRYDRPGHEVGEERGDKIAALDSHGGARASFATKR